MLPRPSALALLVALGACVDHGGGKAPGPDGAQDGTATAQGPAPEDSPDKQRPDDKPLDPDWLGARFKTASYDDGAGAKGLTLPDLEKPTCRFFVAGFAKQLTLAFGTALAGPVESLHVTLATTEPPPAGSTWTIDGTREGDKVQLRTNEPKVAWVAGGKLQGPSCTLTVTKDQVGAEGAPDADGVTAAPLAFEGALGCPFKQKVGTAQVEQQLRVDVLMRCNGEVHRLPEPAPLREECKTGTGHDGYVSGVTAEYKIVESLWQSFGDCAWVDDTKAKIAQTLADQPEDTAGSPFFVCRTHGTKRAGEAALKRLTLGCQ